MSHTPGSFKNDKNVPSVGTTTSIIAQIARIDAALAADGAGYASPDVFVNDKNNGAIGASAAARLNAVAASLANAGSHYVAKPWRNDKDVGHLGADLLAKLNTIEVDLQTLRP